MSIIFPHKDKPLYLVVYENWMQYTESNMYAMAG